MKRVRPAPVLVLDDRELNPQPPFWPVCEVCTVPYVLRRSWSFTTGDYSWAWMRDCAKPRSTCKKAKPVIWRPDGAVEQ